MILPNRLLLALLLVGCSHSEYPAPDDHASDLPFQPGAPLRLTYSPGEDRTPQWAPDGEQVYYAFDDIMVSAVSWTGCVGPLPGSGGRRGAPICETDPRYAQSAMAPSWPAANAGGEVAFWHQVAGLGPSLPAKSDLVIRRVGESSSLESIILIPYFEPAQGRSHQGIAFLQWLGTDSLIFVGQGVVKSTNDNVSTGMEIVTLDPSLGAAGIAPIPGTEWASSVAVGGNSDTLYFTLGGSAAVYRRVRSTGAVQLVYDFGGLGIARDVQVRNGVLTAVVGGSVSFIPHASLGMAQYDGGGPIYAVDLRFTAPFPLTQAFERYRHPVLSPDGRQVVAESNGDLWRIDLPF